MTGLAFCAGVSKVSAAPALYPELLPHDHPPTCRVNRGAFEARVSALKASPSFAAPISATTYTVIVVRIDFTDQIMTKTQAQADAFTASVKSFYLENSYGKLSVNATTTGSGGGGQGAFRMPRTMAYYANGLSSRYSEIAKDAIAVATTSGGGNFFANFDHIMFYHAGAGAETASVSNQSSLIWSAYAPAEILNGPNAVAKTFPGATFVPESENNVVACGTSQTVDPLGVICHEYCHQLGAVDLYDTDSGNSKVGSWSLMDSGVYLPSCSSGGSAIGSNPAHIDSWHRLFLGFNAPETIAFSEGTSRTLTQAETSRTSFIRLPISVSSVGGDNEYFLLEYRRTGTSNAVNFDQFLKGSGLLIWHIDDSIALNPARLDANNVNTGVPHLGVDLVEAGPTDSSNGGTSLDPWPGPAVTFQSPKSNAYNGNSSGVVVSDISGGGAASISATIKTTLNNPAILANTTPGTVLVTGGASGYTNPSKGENTLIGIRPASSGDLSVKVYSLNGDIVKESTVSGTAGQTTTVSWDGKNKDGKSVTSGIYIVHVSGGGIDVKKKTAVIK